MAKTSISNPVFQKKLEAKTGFNLVSQTNPFNSIFETKPLDSKTSNAIDRLVLEVIEPGKTTDTEVRADLDELKTITLEVKAIEKQGVLLIGERLFRARTILGKWSQGAETFRSWLNLVFKSRSTPYNILSYYELYKSLPGPELQNKLKEMPHKAAYVLASRRGEIEQKAEIVEKFHEMKADEIIAIVQDKFPSSKKETKQSVPEVLIDTMRTSLRKLITRKNSLKPAHFSAIAECNILLQALIKANPDTQPTIEVETKITEK